MSQNDEADRATALTGYYSDVQMFPPGAQMAPYCVWGIPDARAANGDTAVRQTVHHKLCRDHPT